MRVAFVFTNYNNSKHTINAVNSICGLSELCQVVIVDNLSGEADIIELEYLHQNNTNIHVIYNTVNLGYFKGLNVGIEYVINNFTFDLIVVGNNDLIFPESFLEQICQKANIFDSYAVVSPNIVTLDNECQNPHVLSRISNLRHLAYDIYFFNFTLSRFITYIFKYIGGWFKRKDYLDSLDSQIIYQGYGACYIIGPLFFKYYKQLFAPTFLMGEEFFLAYQLKLFDLKLYYESSIKVFHQDHASTGLIDSFSFWKISKESHKVYKKYLKSYE
jgi:GT2 family glycosyltransferase